MIRHDIDPFRLQIAPLNGKPHWLARSLASMPLPCPTHQPSVYQNSLHPIMPARHKAGRESYLRPRRGTVRRAIPQSPRPLHLRYPLPPSPPTMTRLPRQLKISSLPRPALAVSLTPWLALLRHLFPQSFLSPQTHPALKAPPPRFPH